MRSRTRPGVPAVWSGTAAHCWSRRAGVIRFSRRGQVARSHEHRPWWLLGLVVVATHPVYRPALEVDVDPAR